jgi:hypothetical protein
MLPLLTQFDWTQLPGPGVRMKFRKDLSGFYEREGAPGSRLVRDTLLFKVEGDTLHLKFAHAREWTEVGMMIREGAPSADGRFSKHVLMLAHDPYVTVQDEPATGPLTLQSDSGAALLG